MSRKGTNIYKRRDGRWEARYVKSVDSGGKKHYGSVYGRTYREVRDKQVSCINNSGSDFGQTHITLSQLMREWLFSVSLTVKNSTYRKYECLVRNHIEHTHLGDMQVRSITGKDISALASELLLTLSEKSVNDVLTTVNSALSYGEEIYGIPKIKLHYVKEVQKEMRVLSVAEQKRLEAYLTTDTDTCKFGVLLALYTGLRLGELCALRWEDVGRNELVVSKTLHRVKSDKGTVLEVTTPKTKSSYRVIPLPEFLLPLTEQFRSSGAVLKNHNGDSVEPRLMQYRFETYIRECGLPKTNFHALRHTFATRCVEAGFDIKSLSEILGHSDVKTTLNRYVHSSFEQKKKNMDLLQPASEL